MLVWGRSWRRGTRSRAPAVANEIAATQLGLRKNLAGLLLIVIAILLSILLPLDLWRLWTLFLLLNTLLMLVSLLL